MRTSHQKQEKNVTEPSRRTHTLVEDSHTDQKDIDSVYKNDASNKRITNHFKDDKSSKSLSRSNYSSRSTAAQNGMVVI